MSVSPSAKALTPPAPILFNKIDAPFGFCSNFSPHAITYGKVVFRTSEHFFQAMKFSGCSTAFFDIVNCKSPMHAAMAGRSRSRPLRRDWEAIKDNVMEVALILKFNQHPDIKTTLLSSQGRPLVEHTARDKYWGDGGDGGNGTVGKNMLGKLLERVRRFYSQDPTHDEISKHLIELGADGMMPPAAPALTASDAHRGDEDTSGSKDDTEANGSGSSSSGDLKKKKKHRLQ